MEGSIEGINLGGYVYRAIATNRDKLSDSEIIHWYNQRGEDSENRIKELKIDFEEVRKACNTKWNIEILEARDGIKGHCLPKDVRYLISLASFKTICERAVHVDNLYRKWIASKLRET